MILWQLYGLVISVVSMFKKEEQSMASCLRMECYSSISDSNLIILLKHTVLLSFWHFGTLFFDIFFPPQWKNIIENIFVFILIEFDWLPLINHTPILNQLAWLTKSAALWLRENEEELSSQVCLITQYTSPSRISLSIGRIIVTRHSRILWSCFIRWHHRPT